MAIGSPSVPPAWLSSLPEDGGVRQLPLDDTEPGVRVALVDGGSGGSPVAAAHEDPEAWVAAALDQSYRALAPGGLLVLRPGAFAHRTGDGSRTTVDQVGTALFRSGFVDPRFLSASDGAWTVLARRGLDRPPGERSQVLSVVLPAYNEGATFETVMDGLLAKEIPGMAIEVIVVESNSSDGTRELALDFGDHPRVTLVLEDRPQGKGHAVRSGLARARGDVVLIQDADLEYDLGDYEKLLDPIRRFEASFVLGRRASPTGSWGIRHFETQQLASRIMNVGHIAFAALFNAVYRQRLKDPFTMYKVFRRDCISGMVLECDRFDFDWELTAKLIRAGYAPLEIPVNYRSRSFSEGKKVRLLGDPVSWFVACARYRFAPVFETLSVPYGTDQLRPPFGEARSAK